MVKKKSIREELELSDTDDEYIEPIVNRDDYNEILDNPLENAKVKEQQKEFTKKIKGDYIYCTLCKKHYTKTNTTHHKSTKQHQIYENMNKKILTLLYKDE